MMRIRGMKRTRVMLIFLLALLMGKHALSQVTTSQYDNARTAATLSEKVLTPQNVTPERFGKLGAFKVDGAVFAQPLYIPNVEIPRQGARNVIYVATEHDSVYAFDADHPGSLPLRHPRRHQRTGLLRHPQPSRSLRPREVAIARAEVDAFAAR